MASSSREERRRATLAAVTEMQTRAYCRVYDGVYTSWHAAPPHLRFDISLGTPRASASKPVEWVTRQTAKRLRATHVHLRASDIFLTVLRHGRWRRPPPKWQVKDGQHLRWNLVLHSGQTDHAGVIEAVRALLAQRSVPRQAYTEATGEWL